VRVTFHSNRLGCRNHATARAISARLRNGSRADPTIVFAPRSRIRASGRNIMLDAKDNAGLVGVRFYRQQNALRVLLAQPTGLVEGDRGTTVLALNGTRPKIGHGRLRHPAGVAPVEKMV